MKNKSLSQILEYYRQDDADFQVLRDEAYLAILRRNLSTIADSEIRFFVNPKRFRLMRALIGEDLASNKKRILNVACGPFAFENYVKLHPQTVIEAFDLDPLLGGVLDELKEAGGFENVSYQCISAEDFSGKGKYDLVLINDLFYHKSVDFFSLAEKYAGLVAPGGLLYFDILDIRSQWLWSVAGKDGQFVRYDLNNVSGELERNGLEVLSVTPSMGIGGKTDFFTRLVLYKTLGIANNYIFVAQKK